MNIGDKYWTYHVNKNKWHQVIEAVYRADLTDRLRLRENRVFKDKKSTIEALKNREGIAV